MSKHLLTLFVAGVLLIGNAVAGVIPGRWEKVDSLDNGEDIIVVMKSGERFNANFRSSDLDSIVVKPMGEKERRIPKSEVKQVEREGVKQDRALDGAAIGAGAGAALGALLGSRSEDDREVTIVGGLIAFAAIGFGVGYAVDSSTGKPILLFEAPE